MRTGSTWWRTGVTVATVAVPESTDRVRFAGSVELELDRDTWILALASGDTPMQPWDSERPEGATNPVWIDVDGNGVFDAPGL